MFQISRLVLLISIFVIKCIILTIVQSECHINPLRIQPSILIVDRNGQIVYSNSNSRIVDIWQNDEILIACPGNQLLLDKVPIGEFVTALCVEDETFNVGDEALNFHSLSCQDNPKDSIRYTQRSCVEGGDEIEIGFHIAEMVFVRQIRICFDNVNLTPIFSHYNLTRNIGYRDSHVSRKCFEEDGFYSTYNSLDNLYRRDNQRVTINDQLDLSNNSEMYIQRNEFFINRGHLTAKGDFVYAFQQLATFHYVNSAPQWASFNGGNWNELEISLRDYADSTGSDFEVYTGVHGVSLLRNHRTGKKTALFLHTVGGRYLLPIPRLFWKIIYNRDNYQGLVVLGVNNAYEIDMEEDVICDDISDRITWFNNKLKTQKRSIELGYIYACSISDFRRIISRSPNLHGRNLLL